MRGLARAALEGAVVASAAIALAGGFAGAVRVLPWLLDPAVPWPVAAPFARGLVSVALEAALLVGWPVGWALACHRFVESGEARVLQTLGEPPARTVMGLAPQGAVLALALAAVALVYGGDAASPGRVATELLARARTSCGAVRTPRTYAVPFTDMTWLCAPGADPRLVGSPPGALGRGGAAVLTAKDARIAGDFRSLQLDDARVHVSGATPSDLHVGVLSIHGMAPWAHASTLPAPARAVVLAVTGWLAATAAAFLVLSRGTGQGHGRGAASRLEVLGLSAAGPLAALGLVRLLERANAPAGLFLLVPVAALAAVSVGALLSARSALAGLARAVARLRGQTGAATRY